ncbi:hypothetical protein AAHB56_04920, partial [Bacillus thuringiensis]
RFVRCLEFGCLTFREQTKLRVFAFIVKRFRVFVRRFTDINGALNILQKSKVVECDDNLKVKTPILLEVQKRKAVASRIA